MRGLRRLGLALGLPLAAALALWAGGAAAHEAHNKPTAKPAAEPSARAAAVQPDPAPLPLDIGGPFALVDHTGKAVSDETFRGDYLLVFFGYANCPGICPVGLRHMVEALDRLGADGARVTPLLITVDPAHDTAANLAAAVGKIHPRLIGLTGTPAQLRAAREVYRVDAKPAGRSWRGVELFSHGTFIYLMGPDGEFLSLFPPVTPPAALAKAIGGYLS